MVHSFGIDVGGQSILCILTDDGAPLASVTCDTPEDVHEMVERICEALEQLMQKEGLNTDGILGAGIGVPAFRDPVTGTFRFPNIECENGIDIEKMLINRLPLKWLIGNDADLTALGMVDNTEGFESLKSGCGSESACHLFAITIGTGIGGGGVIDDGCRHRLLSNRTGISEFGHVKVSPESDRTCGCGGKGCVEAYASTMSMSNAYETLTGESISAKDIDEMASEGDETAVKVMSDAGRVLGIAASAIVNILNPSIIVFSGGGANSRSDGPYFTSMMDGLKDASIAETWAAVSIYKHPDAKTFCALGAAKAVLTEDF